VTNGRKLAGEPDIGGRAQSLEHAPLFGTGRREVPDGPEHADATRGAATAPAAYRGMGHAAEAAGLEHRAPEPDRDLASVGIADPYRAAAPPQTRADPPRRQHTHERDSVSRERQSKDAGRLRALLRGERARGSQEALSEARRRPRDGGDLTSAGREAQQRQH